MTTLSAGAVEGIVNEIVTSDGGDRPVLQVAKFQPVGGANATRHKLWLTDGSRWVYAMAATQVHALLQEGGDFAPGCLVRLLKYSVNDMAAEKIVIVIDLEVAAGPQKLIGAPTGYPNGEALPSDAQPAGGAAPAPAPVKKPAPAPASAAPEKTLRRRPRGHAHRRAQPLPAALLSAGRGSRRSPRCGTGTNQLPKARSRRPVVWRRLHFIQTTRVHQTRRWVVFFSSFERVSNTQATSSPSTY